MPILRPPGGLRAAPALFAIVMACLGLPGLAAPPIPPSQDPRESPPSDGYPLDTVPASEVYIPYNFVFRVAERLGHRPLSLRLWKLTETVHNGQRISFHPRLSHLARLGVKLEDIQDVRLDRAGLARLRLTRSQWQRLGFPIPDFHPSDEDADNLRVSDLAQLEPGKAARALDYEVDWRDLPDLNYALRRPELEEELGTNSPTLRDFQRIGIHPGDLYSLPLEMHQAEALGLATDDWLGMGLLPSGFPPRAMTLGDFRRLGWTLDSLHLPIEDGILSDIAQRLGEPQELPVLLARAGMVDRAVPLQELLGLLGIPVEAGRPLVLDTLGIAAVIRADGEIRAVVRALPRPPERPSLAFAPRGDLVFGAGRTSPADREAYRRACGAALCQIQGEDGVWGFLGTDAPLNRRPPAPAQDATRAYLLLAMDIEHENVVKGRDPLWRVALEFDGGRLDSAFVDTVRYEVRGRGNRPERRVALLMVLTPGSRRLTGFRYHWSRYALREPLNLALVPGETITLGEWTYLHDLRPWEPGRRPRDRRPAFRVAAIPRHEARRLEARRGLPPARDLGLERNTVEILPPRDLLRPLATWVAGFSLGYPGYASLEAGLLAGWRTPHREERFKALHLTAEAHVSGAALHAGFARQKYAARDFFELGWAVGVVAARERLFREPAGGEWSLGPEIAGNLGNAGLRLAVPFQGGPGLRMALAVRFDGDPSK